MLGAKGQRRETAQGGSQPSRKEMAYSTEELPINLRLNISVELNTLIIPLVSVRDGLPRVRLTAWWAVDISSLGPHNLPVPFCAGFPTEKEREIVLTSDSVYQIDR